MRPRYPLNQSPLYCLRSRRKLAELLGVQLEEVEELANASPPAYTTYPKKFERNGKEKTRWIERPKPLLRTVQRRLSRLLDRIEPPEYLHSGYRKRSYLTNARQHPCNVRIAKIDVKKFFPNASGSYVHRCFKDTFHCSPDVAVMLTKLVTFEGHIPTGGNSSTMVSFWAYKPMFDEINALAASCGLRMSCCVDDMTFSGPAATAGFLEKVRRIIVRFGLRGHKRHCFEATVPKVVTGVALTTKGYRLPNARRKRLHECFGAFNAESDRKEKVRLGTKLLGCATEAAQVEPELGALVPVAARLLGEAKLAARSV